MRLKSLIKVFEFQEEERSSLTLGPKTRLNPNNASLELIAVDNEYPTDDDLYVITKTTNPDTVKEWSGFDVTVSNVFDLDDNPLTSVAFRLSDGTDQYYWDGLDWIVNTTDWNTEQEVADNITAFPPNSKKLAIVINLKTTDKRYTPSLSRIKVLWKSNIEFQEDIIYRSLVRRLKNEIEPIGDYPIRLQSDTDTIDLKNDYKLETPYRISGIDSCFNNDTDPDHFVDIFQSYDSVNKVITLNQVLTTGTVVWIKFYWKPMVAVTTSQEFNEIASVPAIVLEDITMPETYRQKKEYDYVANKGNETAVKVRSPLQVDVDIEMVLITASAKDQQRLADAVRAFIENSDYLVSTGLDEKYDLLLIDPYTSRFVGNKEELRTGSIEIRIINAYFFAEESSDENIVTNFILQTETRE